MSLPAPEPYNEDQYRLAPGSAPLARCVGAFRRTCLMATTAVLCDPCWDIVLSTDPRARSRIHRRYRLVGARPVEWTPGAVELPIRGEVE